MKTALACLVLVLSFAAPSLAQNQADTTVFLGDSMIYGFLNFPELVPSGTVNLAVTASTSSSVTRTVNTAVQSTPKSIFIMTGINDVTSGDLSGFTKNYDAILETVSAKSPGTRVYVQALFPVNWTAFPRAYDFDNAAIDTYNSAIRGVAAGHSNAVYLDFTSSFTDASGNLRKELSKDGLHLNQDGYKIWGGLLSRYF